MERGREGGKALEGGREGGGRLEKLTMCQAEVCVATTSMFKEQRKQGALVWNVRSTCRSAIIVSNISAYIRI